MENIMLNASLLFFISAVFVAILGSAFKIAIPISQVKILSLSFLLLGFLTYIGDYIAHKKH